MQIRATRPAAVLILAAGLYVLFDPLAITPAECIRGLPAEPIQRVAICFSAPYAALPDRDLRSAEEILGYDENGLPT